MSKNPPNDPKIKAALEKYIEFHDLDPHKIIKFPASVRVPAKAWHAGQATVTCYDSKKWENVVHSYKHDHGASVKFCWTDKNRDPNAREISVPEWLQNTKAIAKLGDFIDGEYLDHEGFYNDLTVSKPYPGLYTNENGTALLIMERSPLRISALIWGGSMIVKDVGIVG